MGSTATRKLEGFVSLGGEVPHVDPSQIKIVGLDIEQTSENWFSFCPRADEDLEPEWLADIRANGVRQAVDAYRDGDALVLLEGRRRVRAARLIRAEQEKAGVPENERISVRVAIRRGTPAELFSYNVGSENRKQRSPLQRAALMSQAGKFGLDEKAIANMFSVTQQTVKNTLALLDLSSAVQKAVDSGDFPLREAIKLSSKSREEQNAVLAELKANDALHGSRASNGIESAKKGEKIVADSKKMRSRKLLEAVHKLAKKESKEHDVKVALDDVLGWILGGKLSADMPQRARQIFLDAGFKEK